MYTAIIQLITAFFGSLGFALIFNVRKNLLLVVAIAGFFGWGIYLLCSELLVLGILASNIFASGFCQIYAEITARICKTPTTVIYVPAVIPLIPGGSLYNTMYSAVHSNWEQVKEYGLATLQTTIGIAIGLSFVSAVLYIITKIARNRALKKQ